jgi:adenylate cyclase
VGRAPLAAPVQALQRAFQAGGVLMRLIAYGPSPLNRRLCKWCIRAMHQHPGGTEVEISVLFADVRGSTEIAERMAPGEFSDLLAASTARRRR